MDSDGVWSRHGRTFPLSWVGFKPAGWVAEWLCSGLQSRVPRFDSGPSLHLYRTDGGPLRLITKVTARVAK